MPDGRRTDAAGNLLDDDPEVAELDAHPIREWIEQTYGRCDVGTTDVCDVLEAVNALRLSSPAPIPAEVRKKYVVTETSRDHDGIGWGWFHIKAGKYEIDVDLPWELGRVLVAATTDDERWVNADDVDRLVRVIDVAMNGPSGAAPQPRLCDVAAQIESEARKFGDRPLVEVLGDFRWMIGEARKSIDARIAAAGPPVEGEEAASQPDPSGLPTLTDDARRQMPPLWRDIWDEADRRYTDPTQRSIFNDGAHFILNLLGVVEPDTITEFPAVHEETEKHARWGLGVLRDIQEAATARREWNTALPTASAYGAFSALLGYYLAHRAPKAEADAQRSPSSVNDFEVDGCYVTRSGANCAVHDAPFDPQRCTAAQAAGEVKPPSADEPHECEYSRTKCDASGTFVCLRDDDPRCPDHFGSAATPQPGACKHGSKRLSVDPAD